MFDFVHNNRRVIQFVLGLIVLPFAFWGVDSYVHMIGQGDDLATVGKSKITLQEFQYSLREQSDRLRASLGGAFKPEMMNTPEAKQAVLDGLISQRILALQVQKSRLGVSDEQLRDVIAAIPALQEDGHFSMERYQRAVQAQGISQAAFEARLRNDILLQQIPQVIGQSAFVATAGTERWLALQAEERQVMAHVFRAADYSGQVKLAADAVQKYYDGHKAEFEVPAAVAVEYAELRQEDLVARVQVPEADVKAWYDGHADSFKAAEERRASHILIPVAKDEPAGVVQAARAKAEGILAKLKKSPGDFAKLAAEYSADPGSAAKGGDLGYFGRGSMVKPFEDAVFSMRNGEVSEPVRSDYGFHIIKVTGIKGAQVPPYAQMHDKILADLRAQKAAREYSSAAEGFTNLAYEQADSLKPVAEKFGITIHKFNGWITRKPGQPLAAPFDNEKLLEALFSDDALKNRRNTDAMEVVPRVLVSARVTDYRPASLKPLAEVEADIRKKLITEEESKLAEKAGQEALGGLQKGSKDAFAWTKAEAVTRGRPGDVSREALPSVFAVDPAKLPGYAGGKLADGSWALYKVTAVASGKPNLADPQVQNRAQQYVLLATQSQLGAFFAAMRERFPVTINKEAFDKAGL